MITGVEKSTSPLRIADIFPNVSALGELVGFELGFRQLDKGDPTVEATALVGKNVAATKMRFNCGFHQMGLPPAKMVTWRNRWGIRAGVRGNDHFHIR